MVGFCHGGNVPEDGCDDDAGDEDHANADDLLDRYGS